MTSEENKSVVRRWAEEVWGGRNPAVIEELFAPDYAVNGEVLGTEGVRHSAEWLRATLGDPELTIEDLVSEGDKVVMRWTMRGEHRGKFLGVAATGRRVLLEGINVYRLAGGKIAENHEVVDLYDLLRQLGAAPP